MKLKELYSQLKDEEKRQQETPQINIEEVKQRFNDQVSGFNGLGETLYNINNYKKISEQLSNLIESAEQYLLSENDSWFDNITVKRNIKELRNYVSEFSKTSSEAQSLQERMAALYEDIGVILNRYFMVPESINSVDERKLTKPESEEKERIVKGMKDKKDEFEKRYPGKGDAVMYATATKIAKDNA